MLITNVGGLHNQSKLMFAEQLVDLVWALAVHVGGRCCIARQLRRVMLIDAQSNYVVR